MINAAIILYFLLWGIALIGSIVFFFFILNRRLKEKKIEKEKHKDYDKY
jgi:hypothetical protein